MTSSDLQLRLGPVREAMLNLHRNLLDAERMAYERLHGRIPGSVNVLQLAIHDPWFAWLRPLTALLVAMDEAMLEDSPEADARVPNLLDEAHTLVRADEEGSDFQQRLFEFVQRSPDVAIAEVTAARLLR